MKKSLVLLSLLFVLCSCGEKNNVWEYKIVKVAGQDAEFMADFGSKVFNDQTVMLNKMGQDGWELVNAYTEVESAFPNFGKADYVTGIRENTRTAVLNFVFKRIGEKSDAGSKTQKNK